MRKLISGISNRRAASDQRQPATALSRRGPVLALILCGCFLAAGIAFGTAAMVNEFRERALSNGERELENTVLLLTRHFDQQFEDANLIANNIISLMEIP